MREYEIKKVQYRITDFLNWQKEHSLILDPEFQRRSVWNSNAKSLFIDTVARGLPAPIIYLRERVDLDTQETKREIVDGQQRLRTIFSYVNSDLLDDYDPGSDGFTIKKAHNEELAGKEFKELPEKYKKTILSYEFSTHVLPINVEDREVLEMFARLNSTGVKLNHQELRNAEYFGEFKVAMYKLALEQYERWLDWGVFSGSRIARMKEVQFTSDICISIINGITTRNQKTIDKYYKNFDEDFEHSSEVMKRFRDVMDKIDALFTNKELQNSIYTLEIHFYSLFMFIYDQMYGINSSLNSKKPSSIPKKLKQCLLKVSEIISSDELEKIIAEEIKENIDKDKLIEALEKKYASQTKREIRLDLVKQVCDE